MNTQKKLPYIILDRERGLPSSQVHKLAISESGDVWMATPAGLCRYNGLGIQIFTRKHGLGTHGLRTVDFFQDDLLVGTDVGLDISINENEQFDQVFEPKTWKHGFIECLLKNNDNSYWLGTPNGLFYFKSGETSNNYTETRVISGFIQQIKKSKKNEIWVLGKPFGLLKINTESIQDQDLDKSYYQAGIETFTFDPEHPEKILVGGDFGICQIDETDNSLIEIPLNIESETVSCIHFYKNELWIGTNNSLYVAYLNSGIDPYNNFRAESVIDEINVSDIQSDLSGNIWVATTKNGAYKVSCLRDVCTEYLHPDLESVFSIRKVQHPSIKSSDYLLASMSGVFSFSHETGIAKFAPLKDFHELVWDTCIGIDGQIWLAAQSGLYVCDKLERIKQIGADHPVTRSPARCLLSTEDANLLIGTQSGLAHVTSSGTIDEIRDTFSGSLGYVYCIEPGKKGYFYVGTIGNGVWYGSVLGIQRLNLENMQDLDSVYSICRNDQGNTIFLCNDKVILKTADGKERLLLTTEHSIAGWTVKWDGPERIWIGSSYGLYEIGVVSGSVLRNFRSLPGGSLWEFNFSESLYVSDDQKLICGLRGNLMLVDANKLRDLKRKPQLEIKDHIWKHADDLLISDNHIHEGKWTLEFDFKTNWTLDEENLRYRYRLVGFNKHWSDLEPLGKLSFNSLPTGEYALHVQAYSPLFGWGIDEEIFSFSVSPDNTYSKMINRILLPVFKITNNIRSVWKNLKLQEMEKDLNELVKSKVTQFEQSNIDLMRENQELEIHSNIDSLTKIANRRALDIQLENALEQATRHKLEISLILLDIDNFKSYNDTYGHLQGDEALKQISDIVKTVMRRSGDFFARYGGEEFAIILPMTNLLNAKSLAKRILHAVWKAKIEHTGQSEHMRLTVSMGVISANFSKTLPLDGRDLIAAADENLYKAKSSGKNCQIASQIRL